MSWRHSPAAENLPNLPTSKPPNPSTPHTNNTPYAINRGVSPPVTYSLIDSNPLSHRHRHTPTPARTMSRSAADATRFTATGPYASSKPNGAPYELPSFMQSKENAKPAKPTAAQTGPDGQPETPKQKVERLRAQARAARMAQQSSGVDRWIESGRRFANRAHKGMVYSLIVASGTYRAFCLGVFG
jgi:hypothetical protein